MRRIICDEIPWGPNVRLQRRVWKREFPEEYPERIKWALQVSCLEYGQWKHVCRMDNYPHEGPVGPHFHGIDQKSVKKMDITFEEAQEQIMREAKRILKERFGEVI